MGTYVCVCTPACAQERVHIRISMYKSICECVPKIALNACHTANAPYKLILYICALMHMYRMCMCENACLFHQMCMSLQMCWFRACMHDCWTVNACMFVCILT